jgi:hypothetical protein
MIGRLTRHIRDLGRSMSTVALAAVAMVGFARSVPAHTAAETFGSTNSIEARVAIVREALERITLERAKSGTFNYSTAQRIAQWFNWGNWPNSWNNWNNFWRNF